MRATAGAAAPASSSHRHLSVAVPSLRPGPYHAGCLDLLLQPVTALARQAGGGPHLAPPIKVAQFSSHISLRKQ